MQVALRLVVLSLGGGRAYVYCGGSSTGAGMMSMGKGESLAGTETQSSVEKTVLLVTPWPEDHEQLRRILVNSSWRVQAASSCQEALAFLQGETTAVVLTEKDLPDGTWRRILEATSLRRRPPPVIVVSRLADDLMWGEVLNLGGYDLLAKPFEAKAVTWVIDSAWLRHKSQSE